MRIATLNAFETSVAQLQRRQEAMSQAHEQLTSGKRVLRASDDPAAAAQAERALAALARNESQQRALGASRNAMQLTESALGDAGELLQQAREQIVAAGNGSYGDAERKLIAGTLRSLRADLLAVANRTDGTGRHLFGGQSSAGAPLVETAGVITYTAAAGRQQAASGEATPLTMDGGLTWLQAPDPDNPGTPISLFGMLDRIADELDPPDPATPRPTSAEAAQTVSQGLADLDKVADHLSGWRADAGLALNRIDGIGSRLDQSKFDSQRELSQAEDLDLVAAINEFQTMQTGYDAALKTYSIVQRMSLFDHIR